MKTIKAFESVKKGFSFISFTVFAETNVKFDAVVSVKWYRIYINIYRLALYIVDSKILPVD